MKLKDALLSSWREWVASVKKELETPPTIADLWLLVAVLVAILVMLAVNDYISVHNL